jgi:hypothetical protein
MTPPRREVKLGDLIAPGMGGVRHEPDMHDAPADRPRASGHGPLPVDDINHGSIYQLVTPQRGRAFILGTAVFQTFSGHEANMEGGPPACPRQTAFPLPHGIPRPRLPAARARRRPRTPYPASPRLASRKPRPPLAARCTRIQQHHGRPVHAAGVEDYHGYSVTRGNL